MLCLLISHTQIYLLFCHFISYFSSLEFPNCVYTCVCVCMCVEKVLECSPCPPEDPAIIDCSILTPSSIHLHVHIGIEWLYIMRVA